jgi:hypothetical protein
MTRMTGFDLLGPDRRFSADRTVVEPLPLPLLTSFPPPPPKSR